jgi:two-component system, LytTR family, sensor kinase
MVKEKHETATFEQLKWDYTFLKMQVNPHFLHNTLNFLYSKALPLDEKLADGIMALANIMRFALKTEADKTGKVPAARELEHIKNVILSNQLRYVHKLDITVTETGDTGKARIVPFVLISIVENALKHGDLQCPDYPLQVRTHVTEAWLDFYCTNKKRGGPLDFASGVTLEDIRIRLQHEYHDKHKMIVDENDQTFTVSLRIPV